MKPSNIIQSANISQNFNLDNMTFVNNYGYSKGLFHVTKNARLVVNNSVFQDNYSIGRGSILI